MPRRNDIETIMIIGAGPIIIGQGCEFDYSGTQACKALREEGYRIVLVNSNPATIMTDPEFADRTYIEPITVEAMAKIIARERPDALLPTLGGQTGLNTAVQTAEAGILDAYGVEMIGATRESIHKAEDRIEFKKAMQRIGLDMPKSGIATTMDEARALMREIGLPLCIRPAYTLGGTGGGFAFNVEEFEKIAARGLEASFIHQILVEESCLGWKEYELEVMRDKADNVVIVCTIENFDPMGVHTGDSITVAPAQTLTDKEYQLMRDASIACMREIGVTTGGSNVQFAIEPATGRMIIVEMNPRVSRSSALASKATGFPIAKIAAKLAVGYTLDEIPNDITKLTPACFEPTIDYVVTKIPRWTFEKFPEADETLTTQMKSVGEAMSIGRTFKESLQKGIRSMEVKRFGLGLDRNDKWLNAKRIAAGEPAIKRTDDVEWPIDKDKLRRKLQIPSQGRLYYIRYAFRMGYSIEDVHEMTHIDPWFLQNMKDLVDFEGELVEAAPDPLLLEELGKRGPAARAWAEALPASLGAKEKQEFQEQYRSPDGRLKILALGLFTGFTRNPPSTSHPHWQKKSNGSSQEMLGLTDQLEGKIPAQALEKVKANLANHVAGQGFLAGFWQVVPSLGPLLRRAKEWGYSDVQLATCWKTQPATIRSLRRLLDIEPVYKLVDTCAAEFEAATPYYYSTYESPISIAGASNRQSAIGNRQFTDDEVRITDTPKVVILGGGPNRIGQGIEFDYCCVHAAFAVREMGFEAVMVNSNPETVSTDYDTSNLLFFEPLTHEDVLNICERLNGKPLGEPGGYLKGVIVQFGGQTPLNLAKGLESAGVPIIGTSPASIDLAEDRQQFDQVLTDLGLHRPVNGMATSIDEARDIAARIGYPVLVRPSYVLGGRAMEIVSDESQLAGYMAKAVDASTVGEDHPILIDKFLDNATEVDVDCLADYPLLAAGEAYSPPARGRGVVCGIMEHIEEAGIHSGDSACALPPYSLSDEVVAEIRRATLALAKRLRVNGLMNVQYAIKDGRVYVLEVNPRASRTVPFVSKATGVPWAKLAARVMAGTTLDELGVNEAPRPRQTSVKESVFPFTKFPGVDVILGPEMRSTGEVMGIDMSFPLAFAKSQMAAGLPLPMAGTVFISVNDADKKHVGAVGKKLAELGFKIMATSGTHRVLAEHGVEASRLQKLTGGRPNIADLIANRQVQLLINTPTRKGRDTDEGKIRALAVSHNVPLITTMTGAQAAVAAIAALLAGAGDPGGAWGVKSLQEYFPG